MCPRSDPELGCMSRGTRSRTQLPGTVGDYIMAPTVESPAPFTTMETATKTTTPEDAMQAMAVQQVQLNQMMDNMNKDPVQQMQMMMMQTNQLQQQMSNMIQMSQNMMSLNMNQEPRRRMEMKLQKCPIRKKSTSPGSRKWKCGMNLRKVRDWLKRSILI